MRPRVRIRLHGLVCAVLFGLVVSVPLDAHHSAAAYYDASKTVTLTGRIVGIEWRNPHVFLYLEVADAAGHVAAWTLETESPIALDRDGLRKGDLSIHDVVTVRAMPALRSPHRGRILSLQYHGRLYVDTGLAGTRGAPESPARPPGGR
jgi:hypothetical protein